MTDAVFYPLVLILALAACVWSHRDLNPPRRRSK